jgi:lysophospholipase L1-like esterase
MKTNFKSIMMMAATILISQICNILVKAQNKQYHTLYYQRASLFENLQIDNNDIIFLGNSITHFGEWHELLNNPNIKNRGISGDIAQGVFDRLDPIIEGKPAKIFLLIGINDVSHDVTADSIVCAVKRISSIIRSESPETKLYIQSVFPVNPSFKMFQKATTRGDVVNEINCGLKKLCTDLSIKYIDVFSSLVSPGENVLNPEYTNDGLHLMGKGYIKWVETIKKFVEE